MRETRTITQVKVWKLLMNPVNGRMESREMVVFSDDIAKLLKYYNDSKVEPYKEESGRGNGHKWHLSFSPTSKLRYFNPITSPDLLPNDYGHGLFWEWVDIDVFEGLVNDHRLI